MPSIGYTSQFNGSNVAFSIFAKSPSTPGGAIRGYMPQSSYTTNKEYDEFEHIRFTLKNAWNTKYQSQLKNINVNTVQGGIEKSTNKNEKIHEQNEANYLEDKQVNTNLKNKDTVSNNQNTDYEADDTMSNIQSKGKSGYCYIGEDFSMH